MGWQIFENLATFSQGILCFTFLTELLGSRYPAKKKWISIVSATSIASIGEYVGRVVLHSEKFSLLTLIIVMLLYSSLCLMGKWLKKIIYIALVNIVLALVSMVCFFIFTSIYKISPPVFSYAQRPERIVFIISSFIIFFLVMKLVLKMQRIQKFTWLDGGIFLLIPILTISIMFAIQKSFIRNGEIIPEMKYLLLIFMGLVISNLVVYFLVWNIDKKREEIFRYKLESQNVKEILSVNEESRKIRHDMKNMLLAVMGYLDEGKTEEAKTYLKQIENKVDTLNENIYCDNAAINYLIKQKDAECKKKNIVFSSVVLCSFPKISEVDLSILLGNALDNAIEGSNNVENPEVELQIKEKNGYLSILVKNKITRSVLKENPRLLTNKKEKQWHGLGIRSMKAITEKYDGILDLYEKEEYFFVAFF